MHERFYQNCNNNDTIVRFDTIAVYNVLNFTVIVVYFVKPLFQTG